jgi:hypothetical protein
MPARPPHISLVLLAALLTGCQSRRIDDYIDGLEFTSSTGGAASSSSTSGASSSGESSSSDDTTTENASAVSASGEASTASAETSSDTTATTTTTTTTTGDPPVCGNGVLEPGEECDDGQPDCSPTCARDIRVFVSSATYKAGDLMGPYLADALCLSLAKQAGLPSYQRFKAWLSDSDEHARDRIHRTRGRLVMVNGLVLAADWDSLLAGALDNPLEVTETSETYHGKVWTGTKADGTAADSEHCADWTTNSVTKTAYYGYSDEPTFEWTLADQPDNPGACPAPFAIYCFESL